MRPHVVLADHVIHQLTHFPQLGCVVLDQRIAGLVDRVGSVGSRWHCFAKLVASAWGLASPGNYAEATFVLPFLRVAVLWKEDILLVASDTSQIQSLILILICHQDLVHHLNHLVHSFVVRWIRTTRIIVVHLAL